MKNTSMEDIANAIGVSKVTVSKALSGKSDISHATRERILSMAKEMGYTYKKGLNDRKNRTIAILVTEKNFGSKNKLHAQGFYTELYQLLTYHLEINNDMAVLSIISTSDEEKGALPRMIDEGKIDGLILMGKFKPSFLAKVVHCKAPFVLLDLYSDEVYADSVNTDNFFAAHEITNYLIKRGHRDIRFVGNINATTSIQDRFLGYHKSLISSRLAFSGNSIIHDTDEEYNWMEVELPADMPTAFVCSNDQAAARLIDRLIDLGYRIPDDVSVVGFDNTHFAHEYDITTMHVDLDQMASTTVKIITNKIKDPGRSYGRVLINASMIVRGSVRSLLE
jgi:LacI family transcriptional regulator